jgi:arylformamidase
MVVWPGDEPFGIERTSKIEDGALYNLSRLSMSAHMGTHIDAPLHFIANGKSVESIDLNMLCGDVFVAYVPGKKLISRNDLVKAGIPRTTTRLLIKTDNSLWHEEEKTYFHEDFASLDTDAADWIIENNIRLIGIDYFSISPFDRPALIHKKLLAPGIVILEGLNLSNVNAGKYELICLPLKIKNADGAPARVILVEK